MNSKSPRRGPDFGESHRAVAFRYASALGVIALVLLLRYWLGFYVERPTFAICLGGILAAAWIGGIGPCLIGQTVVLFAEMGWFRVTTHPLELPRVLFALSIYYVIGLTVAVLSELRSSSLRRERAQRDEAAAQRERLRATLSCIGDGVLVTDAHGFLTLMNPVAERMTGWTLNEARGRPLSHVITIRVAATDSIAESPVDRVLRTGVAGASSPPLTMTTRDERVIPVSYSAAPIRDESDAPTGVVLTFRDETERQRTEQALREADRRKDEFLATLAHELRNPLAPVCTGLELLKLSTNDPAASEEIRSMMERQTQHMVRLIDDLLDVSRITRGKLELRLTEVDLARVVQNAVEATKPLMNQSGHQLAVHLPKQPVLLHADPNRLTQVISNLLNNAAKYTPPSGSIRLMAEQPNGEVVITISDNGLGIPPEQLHSIFDMFSQLDGALENGHSGLGIGLTLVKRLLEMHGGSIRAESDGLGCGSRFEVRLPVHTPNGSSDAPHPAPPASTPRPVQRRVLVVDDNHDALQTLSMMVKALGAEVQTAGDGLQAIETAAEFLPEIVLMDLGMPRLNGYDTARRIRESGWGRDTLLIATTGWGQDEDRRRTREAGFDRHLVKPIRHADLKSLLEGFSPGSSTAALEQPVATLLAAHSAREVVAQH